jgi:hypothetical protein
VSGSTIVAVVALVAAGVLALETARTRRRLARLETRTVALEHTVRDDLEPDVAAAVADARAAARDAAIAAGVKPAVPRLPLEPVIGPVVRAVALGASARQVLARGRRSA